jgi:glutamate synthase domain-containing protein 2/glutamate synthase domain-containing protein 1/glutamate synthase domain-containing protein 3
MKDDPAQRSLYDPRFEHDSCGVGFVADLSGRPSRRVLDLALEAIGNLSHRGAVDADGKTGDGAGILAQLPRKLFLREASLLGHNITRTDDLAAGMIFLPQEEEAARLCRTTVEGALERHGLLRLGWRIAPTDERTLGAKAAATLPRIEQILIAGFYQERDFENALFAARKEIEENASHVKGFYISSLSSRTIVYKALLVSTYLKSFYLDLADADFETAIAVLHQRYSTNTFPNWFLAQPFRMLAHNGEINTITANRSWMRARGEEKVIWTDGSDSASLDNALESLVLGGRDPLQAMMMLLPEAHEHTAGMDEAVRGFYDYASCVMEPWDGPAAVSFSDGRMVGAALDRNGLRPARYVITDDGLVILTSEAGAVAIDEEAIIEKGRLGPGKMIAVDTARGKLFSDDEIKSERAAIKPFADWVRRAMIVCPADTDVISAHCSDQSEITALQKCFGYTKEDISRIIEPMLAEGKEPVGSMGDDTPLAVFSAKPRLLYDYFRQRFAQVTNPAIDPIRERAVMSLTTLLGPRGNIYEDSQSHAQLLKLHSPVLNDATLEWLRRSEKHGFKSITLSTLCGARGAENRMEQRIEALCQQAADAIEAGYSILILSDRGASEYQLPLPMLLVVSAIHHRLILEGKRMKASIVVETGEAREDHHFACLIGYGASSVNPYLAFETVACEVSRRGMSVAGALRNYRTAVENGLLKIMAKMGVAAVASYAGAQLFEITGLDSKVAEKYFPETPSRLGGVSLREIARDMARFHHSAYSANEHQLEDAGYYRYRAGGEYHSYNPAVFRALHKLARTGERREYEKYRQHIENRPPTAPRDLFEFRGGEAIPLDEVEPASEIARRFIVSAMSHGALSREAHETLAIAMNRLRARSNSGEGGEDSARYDTERNSRIKQVASARFGVTPEYLMSADELEIKISQGSKPGEGGQLPGHKVTAEIASIRHSTPGVTLISPPPHHDIYSIEDLAQLIHDLREINPRARVAVKLVSEAGVGTVAAGVAKAYADVIHISGHDGGTGASPLGSIKHAGTSWELGLAESQQVLALNGLRGRVRLRVDGGLKTGRDVVIAAMLGAEEFGFGSAALVSLGCVMARQCHLNTCPVGIASQSPHLREKFTGKPEMVIDFFLSVAEEAREILARLGFGSLDEITGRSDLLAEKTEHRIPKDVRLDLAPVLATVDETLPRRFIAPRADETGTSLNDKISKDARRALTHANRVALSYKIKNTDRAVGAKIAGEVARRFGNEGLAEGTIDLTFHGSAGQSFGAFNIAGVRLTLVGEANDYVGKGMGGGEIIIRPSDQSRFEWSKNAIIGNTVLYGATGGKLFAAGRAGERFAVRNSGATAVVEGVGDHGCEYMTAGIVVALGSVGRNFAAGMTGGTAYALDVEGSFPRNCNRELIALEQVTNESEARWLRSLIELHYEMTGSLLARKLVWQWESFRPLFWKVVTQGAQLAAAEAVSFDQEVAPRRRVSATG